MLLQEKKKIAKERKLYAEQQAALESSSKERQVMVVAQKETEFEQKDQGLLPSQARVYQTLQESRDVRLGTLQSFQYNHKTVHYVGGKNIVGVEEGAILMQAQVGKVSNALSSNFWLPSQTPEAAPTLLKLPSGKTHCPEGSEELRLKKLIPVKFTLVNGESDKNEKLKNGIYQCPCCVKTLTNAITAVLLSRCGHVICDSCLTKVATEPRCFTCNRSFEKKELVKLDSGGTGFAGHESGQRLVAKKTGINSAFS